jgi:hypothetical protein
VFLALALACGVLAQDPTKETPYYPLKKGTTWTYRSAFRKDPDKSVSVTVRVTDSDKEGARVEATANDRSVAVETVVVTADGIYRTAINGVKPDAPVRILKLPAKKGEKWDVDTRLQGQAVKGTFTTDEEEVTVPAGKYKAIKTEAKDFAVGSLKITTACWFAEKVGVVKLSVTVGGVAAGEAVWELEKFAEGK